MASVALTSASAVSKKRALLIGNNSYKQGRTLRYCVNNIQALNRKLSAIHFQVTLGIDLTCDNLEAMIESFTEDICPGDLVFFFFSGYVAHWNDQHYFLPVDDNQITALPMFKYQAVNVHDTMKLIVARCPTATIFFFDACRSYPMHHIVGLKGPIDFGGFINIELVPDSLIILPCEPNKTLPDHSTDGRHSSFITHMLEYIDQPSLPMEEMLNLICEDIVTATKGERCLYQISSLRRNVYLNYQSTAGFRQKLNQRVEQIISAAHMHSMIDLGHQELTDRDMDSVVQEAMVKKKCAKLWLPNNKITHTGVSILATALINNTSLERLYLYGNKLSDKGVKALSKSLALNQSALKILNIQETGITDVAVEHLCDMLKSNTTLTVLCLSKNEISDVGLRIFANTLKWHNNTLECLDLSRNARITDTSLPTLLDMVDNNRSLNEISVYDCSLSQICKEKLRKATVKKKNFNIFINSWDE